mgnify:CR=1 FL=1
MNNTSAAEKNYSEFLAKIESEVTYIREQTHIQSVQQFYELNIPEKAKLIWTAK